MSAGEVSTAAVAGPARGALVAVALAAVVAVLVLPLDADAQLLAAAFLLPLLLWALGGGARDRSASLRLFALVLGCALNLRYLFWRSGALFESGGLVESAAVLVLFAAEAYAVAMHLLGCFVNVLPARRAVRTPTLPPPETLPTVDVLVPTYDESPELLAVTLRAAAKLRYPRERLELYLLDDGVAAGASPSRTAALRALCETVGAHYLARRERSGAKAGNLNHGLAHGRGELVVVLDADHVPARDFLERTVPWMLRDPELFLVQTPHFMLNPDPVERNHLRGFSRMPSEGDMFYERVQRGLDFWSAGFFCGSAALLRRRCLDEVDGFAGQTVTEDAETSLALHGRGYRSVYLDRPLVAGLAPQTIGDLVAQRQRWAEGMTQLLVLDNPLRRSGLRWSQRLGYLDAMLFWLFPFARLTFVLMPVLYLLLGLEVYPASLTEILAYAVPHLVSFYLVSNFLFGRTRWPFVSELYELLLSFGVLRSVLAVLKDPRSPSFRVTPKTGGGDRVRPSPLSWPFYATFGLVVAAFAMGVHELVSVEEARPLTVVVLLWNLFNGVLLLGVLGALLENPQRRDAPRVPVQEPARLRAPDGSSVPGWILDLSAEGLRFRPAHPWTPPDGLLRCVAPESGPPDGLPVVFQDGPRGDGTLAFRFAPADEPERGRVVDFVFGDSDRWSRFQQRRSRRIGFFRGMADVLTLSPAPIWRHLRLRLAALLTQSRTS